jgi:hypothetical protein
VPACCSPKTSRRAEPAEAVGGTGRHDPHLTWAADARLAVDLDENLSFQYAQDLLDPVVAVEIRDLVRRDGLNEQDEPIQPVLRPREVSDLPSRHRERHRPDPIVPELDCLIAPNQFRIELIERQLWAVPSVTQPVASSRAA